MYIDLWSLLDPTRLVAVFSLKGSILAVVRAKKKKRSLTERYPCHLMLAPIKNLICLILHFVC